MVTLKTRLIGLNTSINPLSNLCVQATLTGRRRYLFTYEIWPPTPPSQINAPVFPQVLGVSAKTSEGFDEFWQEILNYQKATEETFASKRAHQRVIWTWTHVQDGLQQFIMEDLDLKSKTDQLIHQVEGGLVNPGTAADKIISFFTSHLVNNSNSNSDKIN